MAKANYEKPTSQLDLEARQKKDYQPSTVLRQGEDPNNSENGYVGVDPIYQNAANETELPMQADKGAEAKVFEQFLADEVEYPSAGSGDDDADEVSESEREDDDEDNDPANYSPTTPQPPQV